MSKGQLVWGLIILILVYKTAVSPEGAQATLTALTTWLFG